MTHLLEVLERIAIALERIADTGPRADIGDPADIPFPWGDPRVDARISDAENWKPGEYDPQDRKRPSTYRELLTIGRRQMATGLYKPHRVGKKSVVSLDDVMKDAGFGEQWMSS